MKETLEPFAPEEGSTTLDLNFGEIAVLESSLKTFEEMSFPDGVSLVPMERRVVSIKTLLLKLGSAYVETVYNHQEIDVAVPVTFTESELWTLRGGVNISASFNGVPIGLALKAKLYSALLEVDSGMDNIEIGDLLGSGDILENDDTLCL